MKLQKYYTVCAVHGWEESIQNQSDLEIKGKKKPTGRLMCPECWIEEHREDPNVCKECMRGMIVDVIAKTHERDHTS